MQAVLAQAAWASVLALSGTYDTLTDAAIVALFLFYGLTASTVFVFRRRLAAAPRPYRAFGYPWLPALFVLLTLALIVNTFLTAPRLALGGIAVMLAGLPFYLYWARLTPR